MKYHTIITCINFTDYLEFVYQYNKSIINNLSILSCSTDYATKNFCNRHDIFLYTTDIFFKNNNPINRAAATNEFLLNNPQRLKNDDWILFTDADIIFTEPISYISNLVNKSLITEDNIISCPRRIYNNHIDYPHGPSVIEDIGFFGYFQFFHKNIVMKDILRGSPPLPEHTDVSQHDMKFVNKYWGSRPEKKVYLPNAYAVHCGKIGTHWQGRKYDK